MNSKQKMTLEQALVILMLDKEDSISILELKKAYKRLAKKYHPDVMGNEGNQFVVVQHAYDLLIEILPTDSYTTLDTLRGKRTKSFTLLDFYTVIET